ncbi:trypsin-like serine peptidase [Pseudomonas zeae]|jgi:V8-like Glu-specific endopeptidase|uniref:Serine protease n=1 Tax=Pseudomonas zeae TaxID=2745510 RepID=A0ABU5BKQ6_9PSED|nr:serine protease [Pseudomonas zeae]MDX9677265.1 serine protease [Pseudomonas zeae]
MESNDVRQKAWRRKLQLDRTVAGGTLEASLESDANFIALDDRIRLAKERMRRIVIQQFGADQALLDTVDKIEVSSKEAASVLAQDERAPTDDEYASLEAIVAFDGSRPSFLLKEDRIDFDSSWCTSQWRTTLSPFQESLADFAACVGRVEIGESGIGSVFLISPTLAITNRHVAQLIAHFDGQTMTVKDHVNVDFGREYKGRPSYDRRKVRSIVFAGAAPIAQPVDHGKLDLAVLELSKSTLSEDLSQRFLKIGTPANPVTDGMVLATVGFPGDWRRFAPQVLQSQYETVIARLLEGDSGSKRLAPGEFTGMLDSAPGWTLTHDATTINGNSGSPLTLIKGAGALDAIGLHYGGTWQGARANWAHLLADCLSAETIPDQRSLREALVARDVAV